MPRLISFDYWTITRFILDNKATATLGSFFNRWPRADCPSSNDLRLFGLWKNGVSGSVCGLI